MSLAKSIARALKGKRAGSNSWLIQGICHGGDGFSLQISDNPDGTLSAHCHAHQCDYKTIMETLEARGVKEKPVFDAEQKQQYKSKKTKYEYFQLLDHELMVFCQAINTRLYASHILSKKEKARELLAAKRIKTLIGRNYE